MKLDANDILILSGFAALVGGTWLISWAVCFITVGCLLLAGGVYGEMRRMRGGKPE